MSDITETAKKLKETSPMLSASQHSARAAALRRAAELLSERREAIFAANLADTEDARSAELPVPLQKRLLFDGAKLQGVCAGLESLATLPDVLGKVLLKRELDEGLTLRRVTVPIGVIGVVFESRPDALVQIASLCIKSGNCAVLKGGRESARTNRELFAVMRDAALDAGLPADCLALAETREDIAKLLDCDKYIDLIIPRGSNSFVRYVMDNTRIPVLGHAAGICHIYIDKDANTALAARIVTDAKMQYPAACNAVETVLCHRAVLADFLPRLVTELDGWRNRTGTGYELRGTPEIGKYISCQKAADADFGHEFSDTVLAIKEVDTTDEAIEHINRYGSGHTDAIITENDGEAERFFRLVDSAGVYRNCSTRFSDGFRYGFGAEVGISTSKIHARGPVGLDGLVTYKYILEGSGQTVADYAEHRREFRFREL